MEKNKDNRLVIIVKIEKCKCYNKIDRKIQSKIDKILSIFLMQKLL